MKRGRLNKSVNFKLKVTNKAVYTFLAVVAILVIAGIVFVYGTSTPSAFGHSAGEVEVSIGGATYNLQQAIDQGLISGGGFSPKFKTVMIEKGEPYGSVIRKGLKLTADCGEGWVAVSGGAIWDHEDSKPNMASRPGSQSNPNDLRYWYCDEPDGDARYLACYARCLNVQGFTDLGGDATATDSILCKSCGGQYPTQVSTVSIAGEAVYGNSCSGEPADFSGVVSVCKK